MSFSVILSTCSDKEEAEKIAKYLLEKKLIACMNIVDNVRSFYWWKGKLTEDTEALMIMKTKKELVHEVVDEIKKVHSYKVPEVIELAIGDANDGYLKWIGDVTK